jgi:hypothetical protein
VLLMPKIRGFKADLWTDEDFVELTPWARLLWLGMWNYACDNGHLADKSKQIKMRVLPTDDVNCAELLRELEQNGRITRSNGVITIPNFAKHQKPDKRYFQTCDLPGCVKPDADSQRETRGGHASPLRGSWGPHGDGDGEVMVKGSDGDGERPRARARQLPTDWQPSDSHRAFAAENRLNLDAEFEQFRDHHRAKGSTMKDWDAAFRTWLRNAVKWRKDAPAVAPARSLPHASQLELPPDGLTPDEYAAWDAEQRRKRGA